MEKVFGIVGLALFFLFPLVGLLQMSDSEGAWRAVAAKTAPSVLRVETGAAPACGIVLAVDPLRLVVAGRHERVMTESDGITRQWQALFVDSNSEFTILTADTGPAPAEAAIDPARIGDLEALGEPGIETILVGPGAGSAAPVLWLGELSVERRIDRRPTFRAAALRPLHAEAVPATGGAIAVTPTTTSFDAALCGAPFVTRDGVLLALCSGTGADGVRAVPMAHVREALSLLDRRAAR